MKRFLSFLFSFILLAGCHPLVDTPDPVGPVLSPTQTALVAHTWLYDSVKSDQPGDTAVKQQEPKIEISFTADTYTAHFPSPSTPDNTFRYELESTTKMYYWLEVNARDTSKYLRIDSLTGKAWVVSYPNYNYRIYEYYHAK